MEGMDFTGCSLDELERFVTGIERGIARGRAAQMAALREVDRRQGPLASVLAVPATPTPCGGCPKTPSTPTVTTPQATDPPQE
jgi:hypothetical protein